MGPEAFDGGPIGLRKDGDIISIDAVAGTIDAELSDDELAERRKSFLPRDNKYTTGALYKFAQGVGPAHLGACTHPGAKAEKHVYVDI